MEPYDAVGLYCGTTKQTFVCADNFAKVQKTFFEKSARPYIKIVPEATTLRRILRAILQFPRVARTPTWRKPAEVQTAPSLNFQV